MTKRKQTISATPQGLERAEKALQRLYGTQQQLAKKLEGAVERQIIRL
ncbi:hypothetical protein H6G27_18760 [Nostoc linckia FACHB-104]|nr:hypothetical protein [Nostoc linckia FACHB-104]